MVGSAQRIELRRVVLDSVWERPSPAAVRELASSTGATPDEIGQFVRSRGRGLLFRDVEAADRARACLARQKVTVRVEIVGGARLPCPRHAVLGCEAECADCARPVCALCVAAGDGGRCEACTGLFRRKRLFFRIRVAALLAVLALLVAVLVVDTRRRHHRTDWTRTLRVALVLVEEDRVERGATDSFRERAAVLGERLAEERRRYAPDGVAPFSFSVFGPVPGGIPPGVAGDDYVSAARFALDLFRYRRGIDGRAGLSGAFDGIVYLGVRPPTLRVPSVEGVGQEGGTVGIVRVELDHSTVDLACLVAAHELFHLLGAADRYDATGRTLVPAGLVEPDREPLYPQRFVDVMARNRPIRPGVEEVPESIEELGVGPVTAREIGWVARSSPRP